MPYLQQNVHRRDWETLRWPISRTFTLHAITWHRPPRWLPLFIPWSQRRRYVSIDDLFWISNSNRKGQFWGQNDIQTPDTSTSQTECGLQLYLNFSKSARAYNVSLCFDFNLNVTLRVFFFSVALNHRGRSSILETSGFFVPFLTHFDKLCKSHFQRGPLCLLIWRLTKALANFSHFRLICHFRQNGHCMHLSPFSSTSPLWKGHSYWVKFRMSEFLFLAKT